MRNVSINFLQYNLNCKYSADTQRQTKLEVKTQQHSIFTHQHKILSIAAGHRSIRFEGSQIRKLVVL